MQFNLARVQWKDPRVIMRAILGVLLAANLATAVIAFKPFGGSADDLRRESASLQKQLTGLQAQVAKSKRLVEKVEAARTAGDQFLEKYVTDRHVVASTMQGELVSMAEGSGVVYQPVSWSAEPVEGSDTISKMTINVVCQGPYLALAKFLNLVDKSPRFLIIESLTATQLQTGDKLNVTLKVDTFVRQQPGDGMGPASGPAPGGAPPEPAGAGL
jgi:type IV pilus assembly protein PilO